MAPCGKPVLQTKRRCGFTLIEVLLVVVVVGILAAVVVGSFTGADKQQELRGYVERLTLRIEMARDKAIQSNREWGLYVDEEGIRFVQFDPINLDWMQQFSSAFEAEEFAEQVELEAKVESFAGVELNQDSFFSHSDNGFDLDADKKSNKQKDDQSRFPDIVLFSSGEVTPFKITVAAKEFDAQPWFIFSDGFTRAKFSREEFAGEL